VPVVVCRRYYSTKWPLCARSGRSSNPNWDQIQREGSYELTQPTEFVLIGGVCPVKDVSPFSGQQLPPATSAENSLRALVSRKMFANVALLTSSFFNICILAYRDGRTFPLMIMAQTPTGDFSHWPV
jgi:hypothetical protein